MRAKEARRQPADARGSAASHEGLANSAHLLEGPGPHRPEQERPRHVGDDAERIEAGMQLGPQQDEQGTSHRARRHGEGQPRPRHGGGGAAETSMAPATARSIAAAQAEWRL